MNRKRTGWICMLLVLFLAACGESGEETAVTTPTPQPEIAPTDTPAALSTSTPPPVLTNTLVPLTTDAPVSTATLAPSNTVTITATTTDVPTRSGTATPPPLPEAPATPEPFPARVWWYYGTGNYGEPLVVVQDGEASRQPAPVEFEAFFDYSRAAGLLAYGSEFWYAAENGVDSVTDLWVAEYATGETRQWLAGDVGRAVWAPVVADGEERPLLAVAIHNGAGFDLGLMAEPEDVQVLVTDVDPFYAWSPDGTAIAFVQDNELFVLAALTPEAEPRRLATGVYANASWVGDAPVWLAEKELLLYAANPFAFAAVDGSESWTPAVEIEDPLGGERPFSLLYAPDLRQVVAELDTMAGPVVKVYQLSDDLRAITGASVVANGNLAGWYDKGESIVVLVDNQPRIWSLEMARFEGSGR